MEHADTPSPPTPSEHDPWETIGDAGEGRASADSAPPAAALAPVSQPAAQAPAPDAPAPPPSTYCGSGWTIPLLCLGLALIACCVLIPQADANRRLAYQKELLQADLASVKEQARINQIFLKRVADDPDLAERLADRQMKMIRAGSKVLPLSGSDSSGWGPEMSPFQITAVSPPPPAAPYQPIGGPLATLCYNPHARLYLVGGALLAIAGGLVLGQAKW